MKDAVFFCDKLRGHAARDPEALALRMPDGDRSYGEMVANSERIAGQLQAAGCEPGDRVAILSTVSCDVLEIMIGAFMARCAAVPLSTSLQPATLAGLIDDCHPKVLFAMPEYLASAKGHSVDLNTVVLNEQRVSHAPDLPTFREWLASDGGAYRPVVPQADDLFSIIYSSGTTGVPKGIAHTTEVRSTFFDGYAQLGATPGMRMLVTTALYTNASFTMLMAALNFGGAAVSVPKFTPEVFLSEVHSNAITHCMLVPVQFLRILDAPTFDRVKLQSLEYTVLSGSVCSLELKQRIAAEWAGSIIETYGMTEGGAATAHSLKEQRPEKLGSVGQAMAGSEIVILDEQGEPLPTGQPGEIVGWSPQMMGGYFNRRDLTEAMEWLSPDGRLFLKTGDIGRLDEEGYLFVTDRKKDMIISGGMNIYASDIEAVFAERADVAEVAVIAIPSDRWGETPYALVVASDGASISETELLDWANNRLGKMARLSGLELRNEFPRNQMGKVVKRELREPFWRDKNLRVA